MHPKSDEANCDNICDIIYYILCAQCKNETICHVNSIDHCNMVDCTLKYLMTTPTFEFRKKEE